MDEDYDRAGGFCVKGSTGLIACRMVWFGKSASGCSGDGVGRSVEGIGMFSCSPACLKRYRHKGKIRELQFGEDRTAESKKPGSQRANAPPVFHETGDSMTIMHVIFQVLTPARTGGGGCEGTGFQA